jgi:hypothetical protein
MEGIGGEGGGKGGGRDDDDSRWNNSNDKNNKMPKKPAGPSGWSYGSSNNNHETPSQMTQATQNTSLGSAASASASASASSNRSATAALTPLRPRQIPLQALDARRLADIGAHGDDDSGDNGNNDQGNDHSRAIASASNGALLLGASRQQQDQPATAAASELLRWRRRQVILLASGSVGTLVGFVVIVLPTPALVLLTAWLVLTASALVSARQFLVAWYHQQLLRNGLGPYLPASLYRLLTTESIHSFMTDDTFMLENRHLLLYFLPLPPPALERFVQRLAPRHVQRLHRPGLGHLLGESAMQIILGQDRWRQQFRQQQAANYDADQDQPSDGTTTAAATSSPSSSIQVHSSHSQTPQHQQRQDLAQRPTLEVIIERPSQRDLAMSSSRRLDRDDDDDDDDSDLGIDVSADEVMEGAALSDEEARAMAAVAAMPLRWVDSGSETVRQAPPLARPVHVGEVLSTPVASTGSGMPAVPSPAASALTTPGLPAGASHPTGDAPSAGAATSDETLSLAEEYADEELVLTQAVINAVYDGVWTPLSRYFIAAAEDTAGPVTARLVTYGLGISAVSTALGLFLGMVGYRRGIYRRPTIMQAYPRENTLYTTIMLGIAGTGLTLLAHWQLNRGKKGRSYFYSQFSRRASRKG